MSLAHSVSRFVGLPSLDGLRFGDVNKPGRRAGAVMGDAWPGLADWRNNPPRDEGAAMRTGSGRSPSGLLTIGPVAGVRARQPGPENERPSGRPFRLSGPIEIRR